MPVKKTAPLPKKTTAVIKAKGIEIEMKDLKGKNAGLLSLPTEIFGAKINPTLMAQAIRVYLANQRQGNASTKTRGQVQGSTRKIYKQKGTGRARHGGARAPIFVHGGIAHGPKPTDYSLKLSKKMKKAALFSALTSKLQEGHITFLSATEITEPKTKIMAQAFKDLSLESKKRKVLFVLPKKDGAENLKNIKQATKNLPGITLLHADRINTYEIVNSKIVLFTKNAVESLSTHFLRKGEL